MNKKNVLLVDDDSVFLFIHKTMLLQLDFINHVDAVTGAREALRILTQSGTSLVCPDIILLDLDMPEMNGFDFMREFQKTELQSKEKANIIVLSSSTRSADQLLALSLGASHFLSKPLCVERLREITNGDSPMKHVA